jgi:hypothetical protein
MPQKPGGSPSAPEGIPLRLAKSLIEPRLVVKMKENATCRRRGTVLTGNLEGKAQII